jgi:hypothetical protein
MRLGMRKGRETRNAIPDILKDLETRLEAYVGEWRRERGIHRTPGAGIDQAGSESEPETTATKGRVTSPHPSRKGVACGLRAESAIRICVATITGPGHARGVVETVREIEEAMCTDRQ